MTPQKPNNQPQLFRSSLDAMLNDRHPLYKLANSIDWQRMETELSSCYSSDMGRPGNATRLMVGRHYLKHTYNESDESIIERWVENPYWQYFCGYEYMQHEFPIHPTSVCFSNKINMPVPVSISEQRNKPESLKHILAV